jgi:glycosyltransferase involved in cell wall biosynthesis
MNAAAPRYGVVIPACDEEAALPLTLAEIRAALPVEDYVVCVGVNGSSDRSAEVARECGVLVAETVQRGYGHGCAVAVERLQGLFPDLQALVFVAADGAANPRDVLRLAAHYESGADLVLGCRTRRRANWRVMGIGHVLANRLLGLWCGILVRRAYADLGPLRLIDAGLFRRLGQREWTLGWTIEGQILAAMAGAEIAEIDVEERPRNAGKQKVSHVSWRRTLSAGIQIFLAGWRVRRRWFNASEPASLLATDRRSIPSLR